MDLTEKQLKQVKRLVEDTVNDTLKNGINGMDKKLDSICMEVAEIRSVIVGNDAFHLRGMKEEHDEMYEDYRGARWFLKNIKTIFAAFITALTAVIIWLVNLINGIK